MKFSIVTISFNQAEFLERTIQSVLSQTGVEIEYIICDPGSTDSSRAIIEKYQDRFAHILLEKDSGPADGLNRGFSYATGDIFCYLNSDDTLEPNALAAVARFLKERPEYDVICGHGWITDRNDLRLRRVWSEPYDKLMVAYGAAIQIQPSTFIRKAAFLKSGGFNPYNRSSWDGEMLMSLYLSGARIGVINAFLSTYRLHAVSITNSGKLSNQTKTFAEERFSHLMGRSMTSLDHAFGKVFRMAKHLMMPRLTLERLMYGTIFNRGIQ